MARNELFLNDNLRKKNSHSIEIDKRFYINCTVVTGALSSVTVVFMQNNLFGSQAYLKTSLLLLTTVTPAVELKISLANNSYKTTTETVGESSFSS